MVAEVDIGGPEHGLLEVLEEVFQKPDTERIGLHFFLAKIQVTLECNCDRGFQISKKKQSLQSLGVKQHKPETAGSSRVEERIPTG